MDNARRDVGNVSDPKAQALFETAAEVLIGIRKSFEDFEERNEPAWKHSPGQNDSPVQPAVECNPQETSRDAISDMSFLFSQDEWFPTWWTTMPKHSRRCDVDQKT